MIWDIDPEIINIGGRGIRWYGVFFAASFMLGSKYLEYWLGRLGVEDKVDQASRLTMFILGGTVIGARLVHCLFYDPSYFLNHPLEIVMFWKGGLASHGGYLGVMAGIYLYQRKNPKFSFLSICDLLTVPSLFAGSFIRIGNLFNSEIVGKVTTVPWAVKFLRYDHQLRHPTQVYEFFAYFIISSILALIYRKNYQKWPEGKILGLCLFLGMGVRIPIEFTKEIQSELVAGLPFNMGQILSFVFCVIGLYLFLSRKKNQEQSLSK